MTPYSPRRRTALVLSGTGTAGAYHAGVLQALSEAGVKLDVVAGCGIGALGALFAAIDGGERLWGAAGFWRRPEVVRFYGWRTALLGVAGVVVLAGVGGLVSTLVAGAAGYPTALVMRLARLRVFLDDALGVVVARPWAALLVLGVAGGVGLFVLLASRTRLARLAPRRARGSRLWRFVAPPLSAVRIQRAVTRALWSGLRGAARLAVPSLEELSERYAELLADNLGQPGFRELVLVAHDLDARGDLVFALLAPPYRERFFGAATGSAQASAPGAIDLAGAGRRHVCDALWGALALPVATAAHLIRFAPDGPWRGETHRLAHRPAALGRLLEEVVRAGCEQVILVTATTAVTGPHGLLATRRDPRGALGELLASEEAAAVRDAQTAASGRVLLFTVRPHYNPVGPLDLRGTYDERSDRWLPLAELIYRGYEDTYRQFIATAVVPGDEARADRHEASASF